MKERTNKKKTKLKQEWTNDRTNKWTNRKERRKEGREGGREGRKEVRQAGRRALGVVEAGTDVCSGVGGSDAALEVTGAAAGVSHSRNHLQRSQCFYLLPAISA